MPFTSITVPGFPPPPQGFSHGTVATGTKTLHLSGQVGQDRSGDIVPGGLAGQFAQALINVRDAVEAAGASMDDIAHVRVFVVDWDISKYEAFMAGGAAAQAAGVVLPAASATLIGVSSLFTPAMEVEVEIVAIFD